MLKALRLLLLCVTLTAGAVTPLFAQSQVRTQPQAQTTTLSAWSSATALNATQSIVSPGDAAFDSVIVQLTQTSTLTAGAVTFEVSFDNSNWITIPADAVQDPTSTTWASISLPYTVQASTNKQFYINTKGWQALRIKLSTQITGTGTVTPVVTYLPLALLRDVQALSATAANFNGTFVPGNSSGATMPTVAMPVGGNGTGTLTQFVACDNYKAATLAATGSTQLVALAANQRVYVCGMTLTGAATTVTNVKLVYGTGTACATGATDMSLLIPVQASTTVPTYFSSIQPPSNTVWKTAVGNALCINLSAAQSINYQVWYTQF